jgi:hypothetical protein
MPPAAWTWHPALELGVVLIAVAVVAYLLIRQIHSRKF